MKNIKFIIGSAIALIFISGIATSCNDWLKQAPQGRWTIDDVEGGAYTTQIMAIYQAMRGYSITGGIPPLMIENARSEDEYKGSTSSDGADQEAMFDNFSYSASNGTIKSYWTANYSIINDCNTIIDNLDSLNKVSGLNEATKYINMEAHFFRAYCFFNLVRAFGEVPLVDFAITSSDQANIAKSPVGDIYTLIDSDLTYAEGLPVSWESKYIGRLTWGAARSLHARTYMTRNDWGNMYTAATDVINSKLYNLNTPFDKIFRESGENNSGSIFEIQCTATTGLPASSDIGSQYAQVQGCRGSGDSDLGWGWHMATQKLAEAFETGDPRKDETLLYYTRPGENWNDMITALGYPADGNKPYGEKLSAQNCLGRYFNKKVYTNPSIRTSIGNRFGYWFNIRIIRYSDVVLMAAESANELGNQPDAIKYLEMVRSRARGNNSSLLQKVTTTDQSELRKAIHHERRVELAMEAGRFYDLVRWGEADSVLGPLGYKPKNQYLPIPQDEIDASNGVLVQNPNY